MSLLADYLYRALLLVGGGFALIGSFGLAKLSRFQQARCTARPRPPRWASAAC